MKLVIKARTCCQHENSGVQWESEMPRKRKEKGQRVTTTNIKVTVDTHLELQVAAELTEMTQSEVISAGLRVLLPNLTEEVNRLKEKRRAAAERISQLQDN